MTKSSKLIATLGVVAGLGVAALPLGSVFAETVSGNVQVEVEVQPAIAMTISGNNDAAGTASYTYKAIEATVGETTVTGKYELSGHVYTQTEDTTAVEGKTYYEKVQVTKGEIDNVFAPAGAAGKTLDGHTISAQQDTDTSSSRIALLPYSLVEGDRSNPGETPNNFGSTITVYTNNKTGFTLSVKDFDANTDLSHVDGDAYIPASDSQLAAGTAGWNYDTTLVAGGTTAAKAHTAITASDVAIDTFGSKTGSGDSHGRATIVDYNVATSADQATGIYTDTIVYTATTNN